jgi:diguanylate cyclase (GGDEF)-like protein
MVHIFYNLIDDFVIITFCVGINVIFSKLKYEELDYKEHLFCESSRDPLTMLYNRRYLERYFTERSDVHKTSAFMMLDLDNFKNANDSYGHKKGDEVLCRVSRILSDHFRENDCIARLGGDEFAVFIPEIPETEVIIKRVRSVLHSFPITIIEGETPVEVSVSMGVVLKEAGEAPSYTELCESADEAMYQAKKEGKAKAVITGAGEMQITID